MTGRAAVTGAVWALVWAMAAAPAQARLTDPTRPPPSLGVGGQAERPFDLTSTLVSPRRRVAVINGQVVREGGRIDGMTVVRIRADRVILDGPGGRETVPLVAAPVKAPARESR